MSLLSTIKNWRRRISITIKMVLLSILIGLTIWAVLDYVQVRNIKRIFLNRIYEDLEVQAEEDWLRFDRYIKGFQNSAIIYVESNNFRNHILSKKWSLEDEIVIRYYSEIPSWFPPRNLLRLFDRPRFAFLLDREGRVREAYQNSHGEIPLSLLYPSSLLLSKSRGQNYITRIDNMFYMLTSESLFDFKGRVLATVLFAAPLTDEFLIGSLGIRTSEHIAAIMTSENNPKVITSTNLAKIEEGMSFDILSKIYFISERLLFDAGSTDMGVSLVSLISRTEVERLSEPVVWYERRTNALIALIFILSFSAIMFWITYRVRHLTMRIADFSEKSLGMPREEIKKGDELYLLHERFSYLTKEIVETRAEIARAIKREAEEMTRLIVNKAFDAIITINADGAVTTWNPQAEQVFGWRSEEIIGLKAADTIVPLSYRDAHNEGIKHFLATGEGRMLNRTVEITGLHREGYEFPVELAVASALTEDGYIFIAVIRDITRRKMAEEKINASLREKEVLLKEIHHRVKNNMQIITSLLRLQAGKSTDETEIEMLRESRNRIMSMSLIHEKLYQADDLSNIHFRDYIYDIIKGLYRSYGTNSSKISFNVEAGDILLDADIAIPCGLIVNELVSNALKYAFPGDKRGTINVRLRRVGKDESSMDGPPVLELVVSDNGVGMPKDSDFRNMKSLGLKLVKSLSENQLHGKIEIDRSEGTRFVIRFEKEVTKKN